MAHTVETQDDKNQPTLRERKFARTKHTLLRAAVERMRHKRLDDITVKELCEDVEVSEATFFNYFPKKEDLLVYFMQLFTLEVSGHARRSAGEGSGVSFIEEVFHYTARRVAEHPRVMLEVIAQMARSQPSEAPGPHRPPPLTLAERLQAFPDNEGATGVPELSLEEVLRGPLERAIERGELPPSVEVPTALLTLVSTLFGVVLWLAPDQPERVVSAYDRQLKLVWAGLRARAS
jgi:AcrR family transcriptional regulator